MKQPKLSAIRHNVPHYETQTPLDTGFKLRDRVIIDGCMDLSVDGVVATD